MDILDGNHVIYKSVHFIVWKVEKIKELIKIREPLYRETAHVTIDTSRRSPRSVSTEIVRQLQERWAAEPAKVD